MDQLHCKHKGCKFVTNKDTETAAQQSLTMHTRRMHGDMKGFNTAPFKKKKKQVTAEVAVNFCPQCGCDIHKVAIAMVIAGGMK